MYDRTPGKSRYGQPNPYRISVNLMGELQDTARRRVPHNGLTVEITQPLSSFPSRVNGLASAFFLLIFRDAAWAFLPKLTRCSGKRERVRLRG